MPRTSTVWFACFSLLFIQLSGTHFHAGANGHHDGTAHGLHLVQAYASDHADDGDHTDVSVIEPAPTFFSDTDVYAVLPHLLTPTNIVAGRTYASLPPPVSAAGPPVNWRPLPRAPPSHI